MEEKEENQKAHRFHGAGFSRKKSNAFSSIIAELRKNQSFFCDIGYSFLPVHFVY